VPGGQAEVLVEVEGDHVGERQRAGAVEADQLGVKGQGGAAGGEPEDGGTAGGVDRADQLRDFGGESAAGFGTVGENAGRGGLGHAAELRSTPGFVKTKKA
jgi:hypothetical protein